MSTPLILVKDINGLNTFGLPFADDGVKTTLVTGIAQSAPAVPDNYDNWVAVISYEPGSKVWVANNVTAAAPGAAFAATVAQLNPPVRSVKAGDVLSFITSDASVEIGVSYYYIP